MPSHATTIYTAKKFITMHADSPAAAAVATRSGRIVAVGSLESVIESLGGAPHVIDESFANHIVVPGLIDQHLHPLLGASTLATEVISTEDWNLPERTFRAANSAEEYRGRLSQADAALDTPDEWLFSWGYHSLWHGELNRNILDAVSLTRPIGVWQRSCHEFYLNSAAIELLGIDESTFSGNSEHASTVNIDEGHFWENGFFAGLLPLISPHFLTPERLARGLRQLVVYLHANGVTAVNEPGYSNVPGLWELYQAILAHDDTPFYTYLLVDARSQVQAGIAAADCLKKTTKQIAMSTEGKVAFFPDQIKLFADGAIISQLMQMNDGYLDAGGNPDPDHHGEWLMEPDVFEERAKVFWDAGYQLHVHVNGDMGLDMVLDMLERRLEENPRNDHRTVIVHFANSTEEQVDRIARLGAIVSANPYYTVGFADKYSEYGLGPERADMMVRSASVLERGIPLSFHSDLPMAPSDPLALMSFAVNRLTQSGRVAAPDQRIGVHDALRAVTIEAAFSWQREHELGSIEVGKIANFTVLDADPYVVDPTDLERIGVVGTVFEARWFPVPGQTGVRALPGLIHADPTTDHVACARDACFQRGCSCAVSRHLAKAIGLAS